MNILGIESSCDETSAAVVKDGRKLLSNVVASQVELHTKYGGVVPEVAARSHLEAINPVIEQALTQAFPEDEDPWAKIDAIAVTYGPGLSGALLVGVMTAKALSILKDKPLYPVNHVIGHVYANFIEPTKPNPDWQEPQFPILALIVSGLHSQIVLFRGHNDYELLGQTHDDAVGEAYDKVARLLGLGYPGGPAIEKAAVHGLDTSYMLPKARSRAAQKAKRTNNDHNLNQRRKTSLGLGEHDFSFSGLKTAVLRATQKEAGVGVDFPSFELAGKLGQKQVCDMAASFNKVAVETLVEKYVSAFGSLSVETTVICGGVAANNLLRKTIKNALPKTTSFPQKNLCTDNAAMIASLGYFESQFKEPADPHNVGIEPSLLM